LTPLAVRVSAQGNAVVYSSRGASAGRMALRATGGKNIGDGLRDLARRRVSLAHRDGRHADDHVQQRAAGPSAAPIARAAVDYLIPFNEVLPAANASLDTQALLKLLPWTGTIGDLVNFYFTFVFSPSRSFRLVE